VTSEKLIRRAGAAFDAYLQALGEKRYQEASDALERLEGSLGELSARLPPQTDAGNKVFETGHLPERPAVSGQAEKKD